MSPVPDRHQRRRRRKPPQRLPPPPQASPPAGRHIGRPKPRPLQRSGCKRRRHGLRVRGARPWESPSRSEERRVGKECVVRVDLGGRRIIKKKYTKYTKMEQKKNRTKKE